MDQYHEIRSEQEELTGRAETLEAQRSQMVARLSELEDAKQSAEIHRHGLQNKLRDDQQTQVELTATRRHAEQRVDMTERNIAEARQHILDDRGRGDALAQTLADLERDFGLAHEQIAAAAERVADTERLVARLSEERAELQQVALDVQEQFERARETFERDGQQLSQLEGQLQSLGARAAELDEQVERLARRCAELEEERETNRSAQQLATGQLEEAKIRGSALEQELLEQEQAAATLGEQEAEITRQLSDLRHERAAAESRRHLLEEMHEAREGLGEAVKLVLDQPDQFPGVRGLLADEIDTKRTHGPLIEAALGENLQLLVVDSVAAARDLRDRLADVPGSLGVVINQWPEPDEPAVVPPRWLGLATPLLSLIQVRPDAASAVARLLGRTVLVNDLTTALRLRNGAGTSFRFVTRAGEVLEPDGRILTGTRTASARTGWLTRRLEIDELRRVIAGIDDRLAVANEALRRLLSDAEQRQQEREALEERLHRTRHAVVEAQYQIQRLTNDEQRIEREQNSAASEREQMQRRSEDFRRERSDLQERLDALAQRRDERRCECEEADRQRRECQSRAEAAQERLTEAKVELGQLSEKLEGARRERRHIELARDETARQHEACMSQLHRRLSQIEQYEATIADAQAEMERAERQIQELAEASQATETMLADADRNLEQAASLLLREREIASDLERRYHEAEMSRREVEVKREALEERMLDELELDLTEAYSAYLLELPPEELAIDRSAAQLEIEELRREIKGLGPVNLEAIDEESQLEDRNHDLIRQVEDIDDAHRQLKCLIDELDTKSQQRFTETFNTIRENFAGPQGMFRKLFGGGSADIMLLPDEEGKIDWLASGIEIKAKPPGKEPRVISQLSGGEKTMTAVALLMAIFKSKPSPFCILDEVDAALDDANVERFAAIIAQFLDASHFIVITHNKRTMAACDRLYGVTMQERGVSRRVAVRVEHVNADGTLDQAALDAATDPVEAQALPQSRESQPPSAAPLTATTTRRKKQTAAPTPEPTTEPPLVETTISPSLREQLEAAWE